MYKKSTVLLVGIFLFMIFVPHTLFSGPYDLNVIDTPKAYTSYRGDLRFEFTMYDQGGILFSSILSISDYAFLGVYFDLGQFIGSDEIKWNQPGVLARFLLSDGSTMLPPIAIGYSYFMVGDVNKIDNITVNGIYIVASQRYFLFGADQDISYGLRYPIIPLDYSKPENISFFLGTDIEFSPSFSFKMEMENFHFSEDRFSEIFYNFGFDLSVLDLISLSLEFKYSPSISRTVRLLKIEYVTQF